MKKQWLSGTEAVIKRFVANHNNGDIAGKLMSLSPSLSVEELHFVRSLISKDTFDQRMKERSEALDIIIDEKTAKKSLSDALPLLNKYAERKPGLSRESIAVVTVHICAELVGRISTECGYDARKKYLSLLPEEHRGMRNLMTVLKKLVSRNKFELGSFNIKYFQIKNIPLEIVWHFHNSDLIPFTNYVYKIARHQDRIEYVKCSLVELLYELCISHEKEHFSKEEITETNVQSPSPPQAAAVDRVGGEFIGLLEIRKTMIKDLLSSLLCATHNISSDSEMLKSSGQVCEEILDAVISEAVNLIVRRLLSATPEVIELSKCINHVSVLLPVVTVSMDVLRSFLTSHLVAILKLKPTVDAHTAITKQNEWTYSRTSPQLLCLLESVLVGLEEYSLTVLKDILQKTEVNWKLTLHVVSSYMRCFPEAGKDMKSVIDWILSKAFLNKSHNLLIAAFLLSRQCCLEGCSSVFSSYLMWFGVAFGPDSPWACRNPAIIENYEFLLEVLTEMVPYEPVSCLKVHINRAPTGPQNTHGLLVNYITLAKTRLKDLNEVPGYGIFGPEFTTVEDIDHALKYFESHGEKFPQTLLNATLFRRQHFEQEFLVKLLAPRLIPNVPDTKAKFIRKLHTMDKIPPIVYNKYLEECERQKRDIEDIMFVDSPEIIEEPPDPEVEFSKSLCDFSDTMKTLNHLWDTQLLEGDETTDLPPPIRDAVKKLAFSVNRFIGPEQQSIMRTVSSDEIIGHHTETLEKVVEGLLNTFFGCCPPRCHIFVQHFVEIFKVSHILITAFLHKLTKYWSGEDSLSDDEMKNVAALVYSIEFHGNNVFPKVKYRNKELTFITFLSEHTPLQRAQQMNKFYRLAVEYMNIAESYYKISKEASDEEALRYVPLPFAKKVYYLHSRYSYAEISQACQSNLLQLRIFTSLLPISQMSLKELFYQEATVTPFEDFLVSRYEYLFNILTCRPSFDAKNITSLASEVLDTVYTLSMDKNLTTERSWTSFLRDILQVLSSIMEMFPLLSINHSQSWLLKVWLQLHESSNSAFSTIKFFRIVSNLPAWLLYSNSRTQLPSHAAVKMVVDFVNSHLKDVLCDENGFLHLSLLQFLLVGLSMSSCYDFTAASQLFSLLFDSCPAIMLASQVHTSVVLSIVKRFELSKDSAFNKILMRLKREGSELQHFEIALEVWLHRRSTFGLHSLVCKWVFFFNVLHLGTLLHSGVVKVNYGSDTISLCYSREEINSSNLISLLNAELDQNVEVIDTLDLIARRQYLPFSGLSELSQSLISVASLLLLLQYIMLKAMDTHMYFSSNALLMCKVTLSCFSYWIKSGVSQQTISRISKNQERNSPLLDSKLLETVRSNLYSLLNTLANQKSVSVPNEYIEGPGDVVIESIFQR